MQFLPYPGDGIHRTDSIFESDYRVVSRIGENALQQSKAAELHVRTLRARAPLQRAPGRLCRWQFLGYARERLSPAESKRRTSPGTAEIPWKWVCPIRRVLRTAFPRLTTASSLRPCGARTRLPFNGRAMWKEFARLPGHHRRMISSRST